MFGIGRKQSVVLNAQEEDHGAIAGLHCTSFARGWSKSEITQLDQQAAVTILISRPIGSPPGTVNGFNIVRQTAREAEILSIAIDPKLRRSGLALSLMREAILRLRADRVEALFLEVDSTNIAAVHLYKKLGFETVGNRPAYYKKDGDDETEERATALVMRLDLV